MEKGAKSGWLALALPIVDDDVAETGFLEKTHARRKRKWKRRRRFKERYFRGSPGENLTTFGIRVEYELARSPASQLRGER